MLRGLGAHLTALEAPFDPEQGAPQGHASPWRVANHGGAAHSLHLAPLAGEVAAEARRDGGL